MPNWSAATVPASSPARSRLDRLRRIRAPSCPRLSRASTSFLRKPTKQGVDGRDEPGHDSRAGRLPALQIPAQPVYPCSRLSFRLEGRSTTKRIEQGKRMLHRRMTAAVALTGTLLLCLAGAAAHDETKYPDWSGQWRRAAGTGIVWDESKPRGLAQQPPLTPEYQKIWEASMADQAAGGQGGDTRVTCRSNGMPRMAIIVRPIGFFIQPDMTLVVYDNNIPRWIYTDGREMPKDAEPSYAGYSTGKWLDTDGDGRFDTLEVETKNFKGPRVYDDSGLPLHHDNESVIKERLSLDKSNKNILLNEITVYDHALP